MRQVILTVLIGLSAGCELLTDSNSTSSYQTQVIQKVGDKCPHGYGDGRGAYCYSIPNL